LKNLATRQSVGTSALRSQDSSILATRALDIVASRMKDAERWRGGYRSHWYDNGRFHLFPDHPMARNVANGKNRTSVL
jgi:hypothetical protein